MNRTSRLGLSIILALFPLVSCTSPTPSPTPSPTLTLTPKSTTGTLETGTITSKALESSLLGDAPTRKYNVYLPPSYATGRESYPVVYLLHGYTERYWSYLDQVRKAEDSLIATGDAREMIVVFVDAWNRLGGSWYLSSPTIGDYETYIVKELVTEIDSKYRTLPNRMSRGITGCSMGGYGATHLALNYPDVFGVAAAMSGAYDWENPGWEAEASLFTAEPTSWADWEDLNFTVQVEMAAAAGAAPNPEKPPFYLDMPFTLVDGKGQIVPEVYQKINARDPVHDLDRYLNQSIRLTGLMIYHGGSDYPEDARAFDAKLAEAGVEHIYVEVEGGGHCTLDWAPILKFMSEELSF